MESVANTTTSIGNRDTLPEGFVNRIAYAFNRIVIKLKEFIIRTVDQIKSFRRPHHKRKICPNHRFDDERTQQNQDITE